MPLTVIYRLTKVCLGLHSVIRFDDHKILKHVAITIKNDHCIFLNIRQALNSRRQLLEMEERDLDMDQQVQKIDSR